jgi:hypothetical protein
MSYTGNQENNNKDSRDVSDIIRELVDVNFSAFEVFFSGSCDPKAGISSVHDATLLVLSCIKDKLNLEVLGAVEESILLIEKKIVDMMIKLGEDRAEFNLSAELCAYEYRMLASLFVLLLSNCEFPNIDSFKLFCDNILTLRKQMGEQNRQIEEISSGILSEVEIEEQKRKSEEYYKFQINGQYEVFSELGANISKIKKSLEEGKLPDINL